MSTVHDVLKHKGSNVLTIDPKASVFEAALMMSEHSIGGLVVLRGTRVEGIITERDVLSRVVAKQKDPANILVTEAMSHDVYVCTPNISIDEARGIFMNRRIRHLPVVNEHGQLCGIVSIGDINGWRLEGQEQTIHYLREYLFG